MSIAERLASLHSRIQSAAREAGRDPSSIRLVAVSKRQPPDAVREAYAAGLRTFGENYAQELIRKAEVLSDLPDIEWHMIGHVQGNKARLLAPIVRMVQTVDSVRLVAELARRSTARPTPLDVLVEVNIAGETSKSGCPPSELGIVLAAIRNEPALRLRGLMAMPPFTDNPEDARGHFARARALCESHADGSSLLELSMGMSHDLEVAIAEGATMVRIGTALFGERPASPPGS
jgi:PLP dependent protein